MLKLFQRTNDEPWLERARAFAAHILVQSKEEVTRAGQPRFSLWTGDLGVALFFRDLLEGKALIPTIETL